VPNMNDFGKIMCRCTLVINLLMIAGVCCFGCGDASETKAGSAAQGTNAGASTIPMPEGLDGADPLIMQLLNKTADGVRTNPGNAEAWARHASALLANVYYEPSVKAARVALSMSPERLPLHYRMAITLWRLDQQDEAIAEIKQVLQQQPNYDPGWRTLAIWQLERGEIDEAEQSIQHAMQLMPDRPGNLVVHLLILMQADRVDEAIASLEPKLSEPDVPSYLYYIAGQAYRRQGRTDEYERVMALSSPLPARWPDPWLNAIVGLSTGRKMLARNSMEMLRASGPKQAMPLLVKALNADPSNNDIRAGLAFALQSEGNLQRSLEVLDAVEADSVRTVNYWKQYARTCIELANLGNQEVRLLKALDAMEEAIQMEESIDLYQNAAKIAARVNLPDAVFDHQLRAGELAFEAGDIELADSLVQAAIRLSPDDRNALLLLARVHIEFGRADAGRTALELLRERNSADIEVAELLLQLDGSTTP